MALFINKRSNSSKETLWLRRNINCKTGRHDLSSNRTSQLCVSLISAVYHFISDKKKKIYMLYCGIEKIKMKVRALAYKVGNVAPPVVNDLFKVTKIIIITYP